MSDAIVQPTIDHKNEEVFHDSWANSTDVAEIDVIQTNTTITAPEMRFITRVLGDLKGKKLLDVGCGLGEASVFFAMGGADVTATDLSGGMLEATQRLAEKYNVELRTHKSAAENLLLAENELFDIIYVGNLFHHVDIEETILRLKKQLKPGGELISWDPVAYNPIINVYRMIATETRTPDEHPLKLKDVRLFKKHFETVETEWFWFTTLTIFIIMALLQRRNPNKERFWKKVLEEGDRWRWLYRPLESIDSALLKALPFLKPLCWNVVIHAKNPK